LSGWSAGCSANRPSRSRPPFGLPGCGLVIARLEERHDDVQAIRGAALKDRNENLPIARRLRRRAKEP
jgi:hypothetical protein